MDRLRQDLRYALGSLRSARGFAAVAVLTLAVGIGANTAIFSIIDAAVIRPMPQCGLGKTISACSARRGTGSVTALRVE